MTAQLDSTPQLPAAPAGGAIGVPDVVHGASEGDATSQYITFTIGTEEYGVDVMAVREIKAWTESTALPNSPEYVRGVVNLRGHIIPIFDLRCRFGQGLTEPTPTHVIIITTINDRVVGILADTVSDILSIRREDIRPVPMMDRDVDREFLSGLVSVQDRMVALLTLERLFDTKAIPAT
ncbi:MAG TPA: chemotaxis protein CheW [Candidatus Sulfotelmatobacter sp.]|nr:chemotaxis protein CheW [Candidatus Sulfotelmatobacter sp.]